MWYSRSSLAALRLLAAPLAFAADAGSVLADRVPEANAGLVMEAGSVRPDQLLDPSPARDGEDR